MMRCSPLIGWFLLGSVLAGCGAAAEKVTLEVKSFDQVQAAIQAHAGKVVVVDTWSTACEPCMVEFPGLVALHKKYKGEKVACISWSVDYEGIGKPEERKPDVLKFLQSQGATFQNFLNEEESDIVFRKLEIPSIPAVFVYGKDGKLAKKYVDKVKYDEIAEYVAELAK